MKTQKTKRFLLFTAGLVLMTSMLTYAQYGRGQGRGYGMGYGYEEGRQLGYCLAIPDLTEEQEAQIETLRIAHLEKMQNHRAEMDELRAMRRSLLIKDDASESEINKNIDATTSLHNKMMKERVKHNQAVKDLLTADQKVYFNQHLMQNRRGRRTGNGRYDNYGPGKGFGRGYQADETGYGMGRRWK